MLGLDTSHRGDCGLNGAMSLEVEIETYCLELQA